MKRKNYIIMLLLILLMIVTFNHTTYAATSRPSDSIDLNKHNLTMYKTKLYTLKTSIHPTNTTDKIKWSSSNSNVVAVNQKGLIKAKKTGSAKITVSTSSGKKAYCKVKVINICAKSITLNKSSLTINKNSTYSFKTTTSPSKITEAVTWASSNPSVVTVKNGKIKGINYGTGKITVKTSSGKKYTCIVKVINTKYKALTNKKLSVIGDSISTYEGYIPSEYKTYYPRGTVDDVKKTWWNKVIREAGMNLLSNCSWSGSTCIGDQTSTTSAFAACSDARIKALSSKGKSPDIVICYIGINDYRKNAKLSKYNLTEDYSVEGNTLNNYTVAYSTMLDKIKTS